MYVRSNSFIFTCTCFALHNSYTIIALRLLCSAKHLKTFDFLHVSVGVKSRRIHSALMFFPLAAFQCRVALMSRLPRPLLLVRWWRFACIFNLGGIGLGFQADSVHDQLIIMKVKHVRTCTFLIRMSHPCTAMHFINPYWD